MRTVGILYLSPDTAVESMLKRLRAESGSWMEIAAEPFGSDAQSFGRAIGRLANRSGKFDTVLLVTHGREENRAAGEIQYQARTAAFGPVVRSHWYLIAEELAPVLNERVALVSTICFSSQEEFREAIVRTLPGYAIAGVGVLNISNAVAGTLAFFQLSKPFSIEDLGQAHSAIAEKVRTDSNGEMRAWIPGEQTWRSS